MLSRDNIMVFFSISNVRRCGDVPNRAVPEGPHSEFPQSRFSLFQRVFVEVIFSIRLSFQYKVRCSVKGGCRGGR